MSIVMMIFFYLFQLAMLLRALSGFATMSELAWLQKSYWEGERILRLCGSLNALEYNLEDAAMALILNGASKEEAKAIELGKQSLKNKTHQHYKSFAESCDEAGRHYQLYLQVHEGQPAVWPNWIVKYQPS